RRSAQDVGEERAAGAVSLPRGPDVGCAAAASGGRNHPGKDLSPAPPGAAVSIDGGDRHLDRAQGQVGADRADDLCRAREPAQDRARQGRRHHQVDRCGFAQGDRRDSGRARAPVPVRQGARELGRRSRPLSGNGAGIPQGIISRMNTPRNVLWFEVLLYLSLTLDAVSVAFQDRTPKADMTAQMINVATVMAGGLILLLVYFVWLAAQRRKNWPRWVLAAALVLSVISLVQVIGEKGLEFDSGIEAISCALTAMGLYFSFTGDAVGWFDA